MAQSSNTEIGYYFEWNTKLPSESSVSPLFIFQDFQFFFRISKEGHARFCTYLHQPTGESHLLPFMVNSYTGYNNHTFLVTYSLCVKSTLQPIIRKVHNYEGEIGSDVKFVFHFEYDVQVTSGFSKTNSQLVLNCSNLLENPCLKTLSQDFSKLLDAESGQDVVLKCGENTIGAHRVVLGGRSKVFESMLQSDMVEGRTGQVEVKDMDSDIFQEFVKYLYAGDLPEMNMDKAKKLYEAGDLYAVDSLMRRCAAFLLKNLTTETACEYLSLAEVHSDKEFKESVISYMLEKKTPLADERWLAFSVRSPAVAVDVLNRFVKLQKIV